MPAEFDPVVDPVIDPDIDLHDPAQRIETREKQWDVLAVIAIGGLLGSEARYGLSLTLPHGGAQFPWWTLIVNASGCVLIGALMVLLLQRSPPHRLARPFLGVGILGGYTTFSTFAVDAQRLTVDHRPATAISYVALTVVACAAAVWLSTILTRLVVRHVAPVEGGR